jgi:hypothetical protein
MSTKPDYLTLLFEAGFCFEDDTDEAKRFGKHFKITYEEVPHLVDVIRLFLLKDIENQPYRNGWVDGFRYGNSLEPVKGVEQ